MLQKLNTQHQKNKLYIPPQKSTAGAFGVRHFAGTVFYNSRGTPLVAFNLVSGNG